MKLKVTFVDADLNPIKKEDHDFDFLPSANQVLTLLVDSQPVRFRVLTISGPIYGNTCSPEFATLQRI